MLALGAFDAALTKSPFNRRYAPRQSVPDILGTPA